PVIASMYAVFHGPKGLKAIAERAHRKAGQLADGLASLGFSIVPQELFDTITVEVGPYQGLIMKNAVDNGVNFRKVGRERGVGRRGGASTALVAASTLQHPLRG